MFTIRSLWEVLSIVLSSLLLLLVADITQYILSKQRLLLTKKASSSGVLSLPALWSIGSPEIFIRHHYFLRDMYHRLAGAWFKFKVHNESVTVMFGAEARKKFFSEKMFSGHDGYGLLFPMMKYIPSNKHGPHGTNTFSWLLSSFKRTEFLEPCLLPIQLEAMAECSKLGDNGIFDPFVTLDQLMLRISLRVHLGPEVTSNPTVCSKAIRAYRWICSGNNPSSLLFPLFPTPARVFRIIGGVQLFQIVAEVYNRRKESLSSRRDIIQTLLDTNTDVKEAASLLIGTVFADHSNTGIVLCWFMLHICHHTAWRDRIQAEVDAFIAAHKVEGTTVSESLAALPFETWERSLSTIDLCLQETLRLVGNAAIIRRNMGEDVIIAGRTIHRGEYAMYMTADAHHNETIFPDPSVFNPQRDFGKPSDGFFLAWGAGSHPCLGRRMGQVSIKIMTTMILSMFTVDVVGSDGKRLAEVPEARLNLFGVGYPNTPAFLRYAKRKGTAWV